jgi:hypothetical protein
MNQRQSTLFRAARSVQQALLKRQRDVANIRLPQRRWADCARSLGQANQAIRRGWLLAAAQLERDLVGELRSCAASLHELARDVESLNSKSGLPTIGNIYRELAALDAEFDEVQCDLAAGEIFVTTPAIRLEDVYLGPFQIRLDWNQLGDSPYRIVALEPNPSACNADVTHPHVSDEVLCEGDGRGAIRAALAEGRLSDFFLLVWRLLETYAPGRAYVELCDWHGSPCHDCGTSVHEDERCYCSRCDELFCSDCLSYCRQCDQSFCLGCIPSCPDCERDICDGCREACASCKRSLCPDCLSEGECASCRKQQANSEEGAQAPDCHEEIPASQQANQAQLAGSNATV